MTTARDVTDRKGYLQRYDEFREIEFSSGETGRIHELTIDAKQEWFLEAKVSVTFWANQAQFRGARDIAMRALMARLYGGILPLLHEARLAISNGDRREAYRVIDAMQKAIEG